MPSNAKHRGATLVAWLLSCSLSGVAVAEQKNGTDSTPGPAVTSTKEEGSEPQPSEPDRLQESPSLEQARTAFLEGRNLIGEGKWADAEEQFRVAVRVKNTPGLRYYIGYCQEKQGLLVEAMATYREAEELLSTEKAPDVEQLVPEAIERVSGKLSLLLLEGVPAGAQLSVDGKSRPLSLQFYLNPGKHELRLRKDGYQDFVHQMSFEAGKRQRVVVEMQPVQAKVVDPGPVDEVRDPVDSVQRAVFWSSVGVGAVGLGVGITGAVLLSSTKREVSDLNEIADAMSRGDDSACSAPSSEMGTVCSDLERGGKRANAMGNVMVGGFIAAGVGAAGAVVSHFFWPESSLRVDVGVAPGATSVVLRGRF